MDEAGDQGSLQDVQRMPEETKHLKIPLTELPKKLLPSPSASFILEVPNFFIVSEYEKSELKIFHKSFEFANATWQLTFFSKGEHMTLGRPVRKITVTLRRLSSPGLKQFIGFSIWLMDEDNEKHDHLCGECAYNEDDDENFKRILGIFSSSNIFHNRRENLTFVAYLICDVLPELNEVQLSSPDNAGTPERTEHCRISLSEFPSKRIFSAGYLLKLPNVLIEPEYIDNKYILSTEPFEFCNASWQFFFVAGQKYQWCDEWTRAYEIYLVRLNSKLRKHLMYCTIMSLDRDNKEHTSRSGAFCYAECRNDVCVQTLCRRLNLYKGLENLTLIVSLIGEESPEKNADLEPLNEDQQDFERLFLNGKNHDLTLRLPGKEFRVHKDVLMARSPVFKSMLSHDMLEKSKGFIDIPDCDPQAMEQFLIFVYCGKVKTLNENNALGLYYIADKYNISLLKGECCSFIKNILSPATICDVIMLSMKHSDTELLDYAKEYFLNHSHDIFPTSEWMLFLKENVTIANELLVKVSKRWKNTEC